MSCPAGDPKQPPAQLAQNLFLDSQALLGRDIWAEQFALAKLLARSGPAETQSLPDLQFVFDLAIDRFLLATLREEFAALAVWRGSHPEHELGGQIDELLAPSLEIGQPDQIEAQIALHDWATENPSHSVALTVAGWRRSSIALAIELLHWGEQSTPTDIRARHLSYWLDSPGYFPQTRLRVWAYRFPADQRSAQVLAAERRVCRELVEVGHPLVEVLFPGRNDER